MNAVEIIKALRWIAKNDEIVFNAEMANDAADLLEQLDRDLKTQIQHSENLAERARANANLVRKRENSIARLQAENEILKSGNKQIITDYKLCINERDRLKASQPVRCGEVESHSEKEIVEGCIKLMEKLTSKFKEHLEFVDFEPECEEERFCVGFHYGEIVKTLLLSGTSHSGGTSTAKKCKELGFDYSKIIEFEVEEGTE